MRKPFVNHIVCHGLSFVVDWSRDVEDLLHDALAKEISQPFGVFLRAFRPPCDFGYRVRNDWVDERMADRLVVHVEDFVNFVSPLLGAKKIRQVSLTLSRTSRRTRLLGSHSEWCSVRWGQTALHWEVSFKTTKRLTLFLQVVLGEIGVNCDFGIDAEQRIDPVHISE